MRLVQSKSTRWIPPSLEAHFMVGEVDIRVERFIDADPLFYPANFTANQLCDLLGVVTFSPAQLTKIKAIGFKVNQV